MTTKDYLNQIRDAKSKIARAQERINEKRNLLTSISVSTENEHVQSSSDPDKIAVMIADILDMESELQVVVNESLQLEREIAHQIDTIEDWRLRELLHWRYVCCKTFDNIAYERMHITFRYALMLHKKALRAFEERYGEYYKTVH